MKHLLRAVWTGLAAAALVGGWSIAMALLSSPEYRRDPARVLHLGFTALLWFTPILAAAAMALTPVLALWRPAPRGKAPAAGSGEAATWISRQGGVSVFLFLVIFGLGTFTGSSRDALPLSWEVLTGLSALVLAAAGAGLGAARLLDEAARSAPVARRLRGGCALAAALLAAVVAWSLLREYGGFAARSAAGALAAVASVVMGAAAGFLTIVLLRGGAALWRKRTSGGSNVAASLLIAFLAAAGTGTAVRPLFAQSPAPDASERPSVVLIVADTLRADRVGPRRSGPTLTPGIDGLAAGGAIFENASSTASWALPTTASILTGLYPSDHGLQRRAQKIRPDAIGLASLLRDAGYETAAIVANRGITAEAGFARGFDLWDDTRDSGGLQWHTGTPMATALRRLGLWAPRDRDMPAGGVVDRALRWLRGVGDCPFFLYLHLMDPHAPYAPPPPYDTMYGDGASFRMVSGTLEAIMNGQLSVGPEDFKALVALYDGEVNYMDSKIRDLLSGLKSMGRMENTLIVFTSDHGEELIDHGGLGHAHTLYQELVHVPLVLSGPGIAAGSVLDGNVSQVDLAPTVLEAVGLTSPVPMDGVSLWGALSRNEPVPARDIFMEETYTGQRSLVHAIRAARRGNLKIIGSSFHARGEGPWDWALYDLEADPKESNRLERSEPDVAREMIDAVESRMAGRTSQGDGGSPAPSSR